MVVYRIFFLVIGLLSRYQNAWAQASIKEVSARELVATYQSSRQVMVVNFWSTWCKPCIDEIPHFISVVRQFPKDSVQLLLVSQDTKEWFTTGKLQQFMKEKGWNIPSVWMNETNADYYTSVIENKWSGVIPATVIINTARQHYRFFEESLSAEQLAEEIKKALGR